MSISEFSRVGETSLCLLCIYGVNTSNTADFKLSTWHYWMWSWKSVHRADSPEAVWTGSTAPDCSPEIIANRIFWVVLKLFNKSRLFRKDPDAGKDWRQKEKSAAEDEMVGENHRLNGHEFEQTLGNSEEQRSLACSGSWGPKESDMT